MLEQQAQPRPDYLGHQAESVIRHTQSREVSVLQPIAQAFFFAGLPAAALATAFSVWQEYDLFTSSLLIFSAFWFFFTLDGRSRTGEVKKLIKRMADTITVELPTPAEEEAEPESLSRGDRLDRLARLILERHYLHNKPVDRDTLEALGLCTQPDWNKVNEILKALGIKGDKGFALTDHRQASEIYNGRVMVVGENIWVKRDKGGRNVDIFS